MLVLIIVLFVVFNFVNINYLGIGIYDHKLPKLKPLSSQTLPSPNPDPTANWKTYINNNFGVTFLYPEDYSINTGTDNVLVSIMSPLDPAPKKGGESFVYNELKIEVLTPTPTSQTLDEIVSTEKLKPNERSRDPLEFKEKSLVIDGLPAKVLTSQYSSVYYVVVNKNLVKIVQYPPETVRQNEMNRLLSTFRFTN